MKKYLVGICLAVLVLGLGMGLKQYSVPVGNVDKAQLRRFMVTLEKGSLKADCYWNLLDDKGAVLAENKKTSCGKTVAAYPTLAQVRTFVTNDVAAHILTARADFADNIAD